MCTVRVKGIFEFLVLCAKYKQALPSCKQSHEEKNRNKHGLEWWHAFGFKTSTAANMQLSSSKGYNVHLSSNPLVCMQHSLLHSIRSIKTRYFFTRSMNNCKGSTFVYTVELLCYCSTIPHSQLLQAAGAKRRSWKTSSKCMYTKCMTSLASTPDKTHYLQMLQVSNLHLECWARKCCI